MSPVALYHVLRHSLWCIGTFEIICISKTYIFPNGFVWTDRCSVVPLKSVKAVGRPLHVESSKQKPESASRSLSPPLSTIFVHSFVDPFFWSTGTNGTNRVPAYVPVAISGCRECDHWSPSPQSLPQKSMAYVLMDFCLGRLFNFVGVIKVRIFNDWWSNTSPFEDAFSLHEEYLQIMHIVWVFQKDLPA